MASRAARGKAGGGAAQRLVRSVTAQTGERAAALAEAGALAEIERLMSRVPGARPVRVLYGRGRLAVAASAQIVQCGGGQALGVLDRLFCAVRLDVRGSWSMARFAADAWLGRLDLLAVADRQRPGGVALETVQNVGRRIEGAVSHALRTSVARGKRQG